MKQEITQYCRCCKDQRNFYFIGMQERKRDDDIPLYNCVDCHGTQIDANYDNKQKLERMLKENN